MPSLLQKEDFRRRTSAALCAVVFILLTFTPVYAGGVADLLNTIVGSIFITIAKIILAIFEAAAVFFLESMTIDLAYIEGVRILHGFNIFTEAIRMLAVSIASLIVLWQLFTIFFGPFIGLRQTQSITGIIGRALIFIPMTYFIQKVATILFGQFQGIYKNFLDGYKKSLDFEMGIGILSGQLEWDSLDQLFGFDAGTLIDAALVNTVGVILAVVILVLVLWNFIKLLFETAQRFVAMVVYIYLSPLAAACGVGVNSINIAKQAMTLFISSSVLYVLNIWSVGVTLQIMRAFGAAFLDGMQGIFVWCCFAYGFIKIAQQLDDVFNAVGATNVRFSGSLLADLLEMGRMSEMAGRVTSGLNNFAANGFGAPRGSSQTNPTMPVQDKIQGSNGAASPKIGVNNGGLPKPEASQQPSGRIPKPQQATTASGTAPRSLGQQAGGVVAAAALATPAGKVVSGLAKSAGNIGDRIRGGFQEADIARNNRAVNGVYNALNKGTPEDRAEAISALNKDNPGAFNNKAVQDYVGAGMGLADNQQVTGLSVDENGNLSATVATETSDGVSYSNVTGINDMDFGGRETAASNQASTETPHETIDDMGQIMPGNMPASLEYSSLDEGQPAQQATITPLGAAMGTGADGQPQQMEKFDIIGADGESKGTVTAPLGTTAAQVGDALAGKEAGFNVTEAQSSLALDTSAGGTVKPGAAWESGDSVSAKISGTTPTGAPEQATVTKTGSTDSSSSWSVSKSDGSAIEISAPANATARSVSDGIINGSQGGAHSAEYQKASDFIGVSSGSYNSVELSQAPATQLVPEGQQANGTSWNNVGYSPNGANGGTLRYAGNSEDGVVAESHSLKMESIGQSGDKTEYKYTTDTGASGQFSVDSSLSAEDVAAALVKENGAGQPGIKDVQKELGISTLSDQDADMLLENIKKKGRSGVSTTENSPVGDDE